MVHDAAKTDEASGDVARGANIAALTCAVRARGEMRLVCARSQLMKPTRSEAHAGSLALIHAAVARICSSSGVGCMSRSARALASDITNGASN